MLLLTEKHISLTAWQERTCSNQKETISNIKKKINREGHGYNQQKLVNIRSRLTGQQCTAKRHQHWGSCFNMAGPSTDWGKGYMLTKQEFWDLVNIRYGWLLSPTPWACACESNFNIEHVLTCKTGGLITLCNKRLRNITASLLIEVCHDIHIRSILQTLTGKKLEQGTASTVDEAKLEEAARVN